MNFIFICSYLNVPCVIETIEREGGEFRILTSSENIAQLFSELYSPDVVVKLPSLFSSFSKIGKFCKEIIELIARKKEYLNQCRKLKPEKIFFFYVGWNGFESWLIKNLSKDAVIYYQPKVDLTGMKYDDSVKQRVKAVIASAIYQLPFKAMKFNAYPIIAIDKQYLNMVNAEKLPKKENPALIKQYLKRKFIKFSNMEVLLLLGNELNVDESEYHKILDSIFQTLVKYYDSERIGIKQHPDSVNIDTPWFESCTIIPKYLPANLICYNCSIIISYSSATLYESANIGKNAISLLDIIPSYSEGQVDRYRQYLTENLNDGCISYPKTISEFEEIIKTCGVGPTPAKCTPDWK
jgi:hypothetical protein